MSHVHVLPNISCDTPKYEKNMTNKKKKMEKAHQAKIFGFIRGGFGRMRENDVKIIMFNQNK
jgi:hypothetical protein